MKLVNQAIDNVANGKLNFTFETSQAKDEFSYALRNIKDMIEKLQQTLSQVSKTANLVTERSDDLSAVSQSLSGGANNQAAAADKIQHLSDAINLIDDKKTKAVLKLSFNI